MHKQVGITQAGMKQVDMTRVCMNLGLERSDFTIPEIRLHRQITEGFDDLPLHYYRFIVNTTDEWTNFSLTTFYTGGIQLGEIVQA